MNIESLRRTWAEAGAAGTAVDLAHSAINRCAPLFVLRAFVLTHPPATAAAQPLDGRLRATVLEEPELLRFARDRQADLDERFVRMACARGDRCHAILDDDVLAGYAWSSVKPTHVAPGLLVTFDARWTYTYKAFTLPAYRGRRLHALVTAQVAAHAVRVARPGVLGCVEINNFASARSFRRMGATVGGTLTGVRLLGRFRVHGSASSAAYGFALAPCNGCEEGCTYRQASAV